LYYILLFTFVDYVNGGELFTHLYNREHFTEGHAMFYTAEVAIALDFLHKVCALCNIPLKRF